MKAYRIIKTKYASSIDNVFDGFGAKKFGGRWNAAGKACVYLASSESLAVLEMVVHLSSTLLPHYSLFTLDIELDDILELSDMHLPSDWQDNPSPPSTADIGNQWLESQSSAVLSVPSVIIPRERNFLLNVTHKDTQRIISTAKQLTPFNMDSRLIPATPPQSHG